LTRFAASQGLKRLEIHVTAHEQSLKWTVSWDGQNAARLNSILLHSIVKDFEIFDMPVDVNKDRLIFTQVLDVGVANQAVAYSVHSADGF
jgi:hypothetical protein